MQTIDGLWGQAYGRWVASPTFEIRLEPELRRRASLAAEAGGVRLGTWIKAQMEAGLYVFEGKAPVVVEDAVCSHPGDQRKILPYATFCAACGRRIR